ncbi:MULTISPECIES: MGMT family protein [unclassified Paludibacterium]|uniref:MGMT family protein n=1 Tax=unclassified Paludibacterium TaxID=2618429 RepID=UPI001C03F1D1|nr:MGMT family protein [Paludibacterium sp. B53371]BEV72722.1 DNA base-flipping protein [Paludibacterium sp. THUN1379]
MQASTTLILQAMQRVVAEIPAGRVMSYGAVARAAGFPRHVRLVARALACAPSPLPWFRVLNARGSIPVRGLTGDEALQRLLLEEEGIAFDQNGRLDMRALAWAPDEQPHGD